MIVLVIFLGFFTSIFMDFVGNNKMVLENFLLENSESVQGSFSFSTFVVGVHKMCDAELSVTGFRVSKSEYECKPTNEFTGDGLEGCLCVYNCLSCAPSGNSHQLVFNFKDYMMTHMIVFAIEVPHYISGQSYTVNGTMNSGNTIFTGNELPNTFSFSLNNARYVAITSMAAFIEVFGISQETVSKGYTIQMTGKFPGSYQPNNEDFELSNGLQVVFDIQQSFGTYVSRETIRQNFFTFLAQVLTILSMLTVIGSVILGCIERRVQDVEKLMGKKPSDENDEYMRQHHGDFSRGSQKISPYNEEEEALDEQKIAEEVAVGEMPRSVEPFLLQKWRKQLNKRRQVIALDGGDGLAFASGDDRSSSDDTRSEGTGESTHGTTTPLPSSDSATVAADERPRTVARFRYDPSALLQDIAPGQDNTSRRVLRPETSLRLFEVRDQQTPLSEDEEEFE